MRYLLLLTMIFFYGILPSDAYAYLDPGTGSIILQAIAAGLIAVGGVWYALKEKIRSFLAKNKEKTADTDKKDSAL